MAYSSWSHPSSSMDPSGLSALPWPLSALTTTVLLATLTVYSLLSYLARQKCHPREPPIVNPPLPIPYLGHLILMALQGGHYIRALGLSRRPSRRSSSPPPPVFTLVVPFSRLYVVTSPALAAVVQRRPPRQLSADALLPPVVRRVMGLDAETTAIVGRGLDPERGEAPGLLAELHAMLVSYLGPGPRLDDLTLRSARGLCGGLDAWADSVVAVSSVPGEVQRGGDDGGGGGGGGSSGGGRVVAEELLLLPWIRHLVARASARVLYGARNPFAAHPERQLEPAFWDFDHGLGRLLMGALPSVTAGRAYRGREKLVAAFVEYIDGRHYEPATTTPPPPGKVGVAEEKEEEEEKEKEGGGGGGGGDGAAQIILNRIRIARSHGFPTDGVARSELSFLFAAIVNTATVTFWTLVRIFSDPALRDAVRSELTSSSGSSGGRRAPAVTTRDGPTGERSRRRLLSMSALAAGGYQAASPTLYAVYREVLRLGSNNFSTRLVREDALVAAGGAGGGDEYFLRRGGVVQIAGGVMHADRSIWGEDAGEFNPRRHARENNNNNSSSSISSSSSSSKGGAGGDKEQEDVVGREGRGVHPAAFRGFGGGRTICPGRYFATGEIMALVACVVLRFEMEGVGGKGIHVPEIDDYILPVHILEPVAGEPVRVRLSLREGRDGGRVEIVP